MLIKINEQTLALIKNEVFRQYAQIYVNIYKRFLTQLKNKGIEVDGESAIGTSEKLCALQGKGAVFGNEGRSLHINWLSPACKACRKGVGSITFYISLLCHRSCYYCFNPNQENYEYFSQNRRNCIAELDCMNKKGQKISHLALTGGEPLLHKQEAIEFFQYAQEKFRRAHTRLYTAGDLLDEKTLQALHKAGLEEIRFSIKLEDSQDAQQSIYNKMMLAKQYIPDVMVEMPVIPGTLEQMKDLLRRLDHMKIAGINLLEFCFPYHNTGEFKRRSLLVKNPPYEVLYDYWYAGGLPIARSEEACLELVDFALEERLRIGVHYCSLENKHTGQVYQQNSNQSVSALAYLSPRDYFYKTAKVFGPDIPTAQAAFKKRKVYLYKYNKDYNFLEFHVKEVHQLKHLNLEIGISSQIMEQREAGNYLRELKIDLVDADKFDIRLV